VPCLAGSKVKQIAIMNGIEPQMFLGSRKPSEFRQRHDLGSDLFLFGFLGRFMPQKGFDKIIEALAQLETISVSCDYRLVAVGSGDYKHHYEAMAVEKGVSYRILFLPFQQDVAEIYRDLDAVVMPSRWEACGLLAMEALVSGIPIITSNCIGLREVVRNTPAIVVSNGDPEELAVAMENLMRIDQSHDFEAFRDTAASRFDVRQTANNIEKLFKQALTK